MSANSNSEDSASPKSESPNVYKTAPVLSETHKRLTAFKKGNLPPLSEKSFDEAVNDLLDAVGFPEADEIGDLYPLSIGGTNSSAAEEESSPEAEH